MAHITLPTVAPRTAAALLEAAFVIQLFATAITLAIGMRTGTARP